MPLTPDQKGSIAEAKIAAAAIELGVPVLRPINGGSRYDLVFDVGRLLRIQCKWALRQGDVVEVRCRTSRRGPHGFIRTSYTAAEVDFIAAYCAAVDGCYLLPIERFSGRTMVYLRLRPTKNNQRAGVHWAEDYELTATLPRFVGP